MSSIQIAPVGADYTFPTCQIAAPSPVQKVRPAQKFCSGDPQAGAPSTRPPLSLLEDALALH